MEETMKKLNIYIPFLIVVLTLYCIEDLENLESKINKKGDSSEKISSWTWLYFLEKGNLCSNETFKDYKIIYSNQTYYMEGSYNATDYEDKLIFTFALGIFSNIDEKTMLLEISQLKANLIALFVDRDIKLTLEVLENNCRIFFINKAICKEQDKDPFFYHINNPAAKGHSLTSSITINSSSTPTASIEYHKNSEPYYELIEVRSHWENGIAPKNCKFKITTEDL
jgi:hypothetical protein